jgi:hypothetical protein
MLSVAPHLPPPVRDTRGHAFAAAIDLSAALEPFLACPAKTKIAPDAVLLELARQLGVAGPRWQAMKTRQKREALVNAAPLLQRRRGTPWAVEETMRLLGFDDAFVLDRVRLLKYDGEAIHDGTYNFESGFGTRCWDYLIRLFIGPESRALTAFDRYQAAATAEVWAPLHSNCVGFHARHVLESRVESPTETASMVRAVVMRDSAIPARRQEITTFYVAQSGDSVTIKWRLNPTHITIPDVSSVALLMLGGLSEIDRQQMPIIEMHPCVTYEGSWTLKAEAQ